MHLYESFFAGCVPVILSDEYEVAWSWGEGLRRVVDSPTSSTSDGSGGGSGDVIEDGVGHGIGSALDWPSFSIKWPEAKAGAELARELRKYLRREEDVPASEREPYAAVAARTGRNNVHSMPPSLAKLEKMKQNLEAHACFFDWYSRDANCSPYKLFMRSLAEKRARAQGAVWSSYSKELESETKTNANAENDAERYWHYNKNDAPFAHLRRRSRYHLGYDLDADAFAWLGGGGSGYSGVAANG